MTTTQPTSEGNQTMNEETRNEIVSAVEAADLCCPEQVTDAVLSVAESGGDWRAELAGAVERDPAERRALGI